MNKNAAEFTLTAIVPVMNETYSLTQTCEIIVNECGSDLKSILIVTSPRTEPASIKAAEELVARYPIVTRFEQTRRFVGGAYQDAFDRLTTTHAVILSSDLETNPHDVKDMIKLARLSPECIVATSRWKTKSSFHGYSKVKLVLNYIFQKMFSLLFMTSLTDMTYGFRLYPTSVLKTIRWESLKHPFFFETVLKPLKMGVKVVEIPSVWHARTEGVSQNPFWANFKYLWWGFKIRFTPAKAFIRK